MGDVTAHFNIEEFRSGDGVQYPEDWRGRLEELCDQLEIIRRTVGRGDQDAARLIVTSGYRTPAHNASVGGAEASGHCQGRAADIVAWRRAGGGEWEACLPDALARIITQLRDLKTLPLGGLGWYGSFTHFDIRGVEATFGDRRPQ